ncbi:MAG TPA: diadenylate cyclase [Acidimicrobiales bacterium]|nr:diadenylate cyclase [Acidimicrobiales bacterium]
MTTDRERFLTRRRARLRQEIGDAGLRLRLEGRVGEALLEELDYARFPPVHEGDFPAYGAVLLGPTAPPPEGVGAVVHQAAPGSEQVLRLMADGRQAFFLRRAGRSALMVLPTPHDREGELVRLRAYFGTGRFAAVHRIPGGVVRVFGRSALAVWDGGHWWQKPYAGSYARAVLRAVPGASPEAAAAILEFCVHTMSPSPAGATLVWAMEQALVDELCAACRRPIPTISLEDWANHAPLRQLLAQTDGAAVLSPAGELMDIGVFLQASAEAFAAIPMEPERGTRHASARRFSFDHGAALVFVVSQDGPVTVYYRGTVVASIRSRPEDEGHGDGDDTARRRGPP